MLGLMPTMPRCSRGCESVKVVRDGVQRRGGRERQRYRCVLADGTFHRFVGEGALSNTRGEGHACGECDRPLETDGGPVVPLRGHYLVKEVATALWSVAGGVSYTEAATRVRRGAWGHAGEDRRADTTVASGQTVADWLARYGRAAAAPYAETEWPETLVLDSTRFMYVDARSGTSNQLFCVLAAWGYPAGARRGRLWALRAYPLQDAPTWKDFLQRLPGRPESVVMDRDYGAIGGAQAHWGRGAKAVPIHLCEHHLYAKGKEALKAGGHTGRGNPLQTALAGAMSSREGWDAFHQLAQEAGGAAGKWATHWDKRLRAQTRRRASIPAHYANGAIEAPLEEVRRILSSRRWTFRNAERMHVLLELVRVRYNRSATEADFATALRRGLTAGPLPVAYITTDPRLPGQRVSSSSLRAWQAQQPARHQPRFPAAGPRFITPPP